jgi:hypothetical protein
MTAADEVFEFDSFVSDSGNNIWGGHLVVPTYIVQAIVAIAPDKRVVCRINDALEWQCALLSNGNGNFVISINKKNRDKLKLKSGMPIKVALRKDESEYGLPMPEEFEAILESDPDAKAHFDALTAGKKRSLLYIANNAKSSDRRIERGLVIAEHLVQQKGTIDGKILYAALRGK